MAKRIIKPDSGNTLVLQEDNGSIDALTVETNGNTTLGGNLVIPDSGTIGSTSDTDAITIDSSGKVGVGTSSPASALHIVQDTGTANDWINTGQGIIIVNQSATKAASLKLVGSSSNANQIVWGGGAGDSYLAFKNYTAERMRIDSSGNVGIGTTSPSYPLDIFNATDGIRLGSDIVGYRIFRHLTGTNAGLLEFYGIQSNYNGYIFSGANGERMRIDYSGNLKFNSGYGSVATAYGCRAWVNFNGTGTVAIRSSGNVSSITDNGTGNYVINFNTSITDTNYATQICCRDETGTGGRLVGDESYSYSANRGTSSVAVDCFNSNDSVLKDSSIVSVCIFR